MANGSSPLLCASELATNAVLHGRSGRPGGRVAVRAMLRAGRVRVEVEDEGGPWRPGGGQNGQSGRGLAIVGQLASRWGRDDYSGRRTVWFEVEWCRVTRSRGYYLSSRDMRRSA